MNNALKTRYALPTEEKELRAAIEGVCAEFGKVRQLRLVPARHVSGLQCLCLLTLDPPEAEEALKSALHVFAYGEQIGFFADVAEHWKGAKM